MRHLPDRLQYNLVGVHFVAARESPSVATNRHNEFWGLVQPIDTDSTADP